ncbi:MAG: hypothetical protein WBI07_13625 [Mobilitalea sp.]
MDGKNLEEIMMNAEAAIYHANIQTVAEGVENEAQYNELMQMECDFI